MTNVYNENCMYVLSVLTFCQLQPKMSSGGQLPTSQAASSSASASAVPNGKKSVNARALAAMSTHRQAQKDAPAAPRRELRDAHYKGVVFMSGKKYMMEVLYKNADGVKGETNMEVFGSTYQRFLNGMYTGKHQQSGVARGDSQIQYNRCYAAAQATLQGIFDNNKPAWAILIDTIKALREQGPEIKDMASIGQLIWLSAQIRDCAKQSILADPTGSPFVGMFYHGRFNMTPEAKMRMRGAIRVGFGTRNLILGSGTSQLCDHTMVRRLSEPNAAVMTAQALNMTNADGSNLTVPMFKGTGTNASPNAVQCPPFPFLILPEGHPYLVGMTRTKNVTYFDAGRGERYRACAVEPGTRNINFITDVWKAAGLGAEESSDAKDENDNQVVTLNNYLTALEQKQVQMDPGDSYKLGMNSVFQQQQTYGWTPPNRNAQTQNLTFEELVQRNMIEPNEAVEPPLGIIDGYNKTLGEWLDDYRPGSLNEEDEEGDDTSTVATDLAPTGRPSGSLGSSRPSGSLWTSHVPGTSASVSNPAATFNAATSTTVL